MLNPRALPSVAFGISRILAHPHVIKAFSRTVAIALVVALFAHDPALLRQMLTGR